MKCAICGRLRADHHEFVGLEVGLSFDPPVPILTFPCDGKVKEWWLTQRQVVEWQALFPSLDVERTCRAALAWVLAKPERRKTARGCPAFLVAWLSREQDRPRNGQNAPHASTGAATRDAVRRCQPHQGREIPPHWLGIGAHSGCYDCEKVVAARRGRHVPEELLFAEGKP